MLALTTPWSVRSSAESMAPLTVIDRCGELRSSLLTAWGSAAAENPAKAAIKDAAISVLISTLTSNGHTDLILGQRIAVRAVIAVTPRHVSAALVGGRGANQTSGRLCPNNLASQDRGPDR